MRYRIKKYEQLKCFQLQTCTVMLEIKCTLTKVWLYPKYIVVLNMYIEECKLLQSWLERVAVCNGCTPGDQQPNQSKPVRKNTHMGK